MFRIIGSIAAGAAALFTPVVAAAATPSATPHAVITASTAVSNRPDSGVQGNNWALDTFKRVASVKLVGEVANTNCPGTDTGHCYLWDFTITDSGHFKAIAGQLAPRTGTLERALTGTFAGGTSNGQFYSSWKTAKATRVPTTENDNGADPSGASHDYQLGRAVLRRIGNLQLHGQPRRPRPRQLGLDLHAELRHEQPVPEQRIPLG